MGARLSNIPLDNGPWRGEVSQSPDDLQLRAAGAINYLSRSYSDGKHDPVSLFVLFGRPGLISAHTPDRCYPAAGFDPVGETTREHIDFETGDAEFGVSNFTKTDSSGPQKLRVYWAYASEDGKWLAPGHLKWAFGGSWGVYKIYVIVPVTEFESTVEQNRVVEFIRLFLPQLNHALFDAAAGGQAPSGAGAQAEPVAPRS